MFLRKAIYFIRLLFCCLTVIFCVYFFIAYSKALDTNRLNSSNQINGVDYMPFVSLELPLKRTAVRARCPICSYAATLSIRRIVSESHFCSHACWLLSLTLVRCNGYCKSKVRPKNRAVGGVALAGLGIVHILSPVSMVTCAFSHSQHGSRIQKIVLLHQWPCFYPFKDSLI